MAKSDLVNGIKQDLLQEFATLKRLHGSRWRAKLREQNSWHDTTAGQNAWHNIAKGTTGNEALRTILADMRTIIEAESALKIQVTKRLARPVRSAPATPEENYPAARKALADAEKRRAAISKKISK